MPKRQVFFSFHFENDNWRAGQVRNIGVVKEDTKFHDNDWESVRSKSDPEIKKWIDSQLEYRSCIVVLIGSETSNREWVSYEIKRAYQLEKGIVGIYVHNLKDSNGKQSSKGRNPFDNFTFPNGVKLSKYVTSYDPPFSLSEKVYQDIENNIEKLIEDSMSKKGTF